MSIFLMGVHDPSNDRWVTVSKCGSGLDDKTLEALNRDLDMRKIGKDHTKVRCVCPGSFAVTVKGDGPR